ncbi:MAG TPA: sterol desaturase family protein [Stellaceae bacterium]|jgi:sterol desaturase/sphingolipid hydroxylase (fatty acid hydroxylase superfamily)
MILIALLGSMTVVALWELCVPRRRREFPALRRRVGNITFCLVNMAIAGFFVPSAAVRAPLAALFGIRLPVWPIAAGAASLVAGFLLLDLIRYGVHRCEHKVRLLWRLHALHHSDPDVDVTTAVRHHPLEYLLTAAVYWGVVVAFDIPLTAVALHGAAAFAATAFQHGNIRLPEQLERWLQPMLMTTDLHRVHHSVARQHADSNYGAVLSVWDRIFGTYVAISRNRQDEIVFGVADLPRSDCVKPSTMLLTPWLIGRARPAGTGAGKQMILGD